jgi:hypothetical protein
MLFPKYFKGLFDFGYQRRGLEVPTFYFVYLIATIMAGAVVGQTISALLGSDQIRVTWRVDHIVASIIYLILTHAIIKKKGMGETIKIIWILPLVTAGLTLYIGHVVALIIPTILSTRPNNYLKKQTPPTTEKPNDTQPNQQNSTEQSNPTQ